MRLAGCGRSAGKKARLHRILYQRCTASSTSTVWATDESVFGNTARVAEAIADGLRPAFDVTVADACTAPTVDDASLIVIGPYTPSG